MALPTPTKSAYVPPHLRNRPASSPSAQASGAPATPPGRSYNSAPTRSASRTPWASPDQAPPASASASTSAPTHPGRTYLNSITSPSPRRGDRGTRAEYRSPATNGGGGYSAPSLYVFGDSFVGPFKLLSDEHVKVQTFKGSSAKGLNNPKSIKQVSKDLVPILNHLLAPPPYAYTPSSGRWTLLIFGNVDLQINYLWQLSNKPISSLSRNNGAPATEASEPVVEDADGEDSAQNGGSREDPSRRSSNVLATATETSSKGPALGPEAFVDSVAGAYTAWLEREIVNGPVGLRLAEAAEQRRSDSNAGGGTRRRPPPSKVLVAAALPPLVEDELLPRIPEKYVERLEEDHEKAQRAMERASASASASSEASRTPWSRSHNANGNSDGSPKSKKAGLTEEDTMEFGVSTMSISDSSQSSPTSQSTASSESQRTTKSTSTIASSVTSITASSPVPSPTPPKSTSETKTPIPVLLAHEPPLCTLPVRVRMTDTFNALVREFCARHPDVLSFIDISSAMRDGSEQPSVHGEVDRGVWACPVDPTNVHPLWEPTLPLWLNELRDEGLKTDTWRISDDAEETFRAYEVDKRRRTEAGQAKREERIKIRDE